VKQPLRDRILGVLRTFPCTLTMLVIMLSAGRTPVRQALGELLADGSVSVIDTCRQRNGRPAILYGVINSTAQRGR